MDKLSGMSVFARVVEARSFTGAARQLGMSKAAVSKQVSRLEERLGARLLNRTTRRLSLTEVGTAFYERAAHIVAEALEAELAVSRLHASPRGTLRLNAPVAFGVRYLAPILPEFMHRHAELGVDIALNDRFVDLVEEGYDLAVRIAHLPDSSLIARKLADSRRIVCAAPDYWARNGRPEEPSDLATHNCFGYSYLATRDEWRFRGPGGPISVRVEGTLTTNNGDISRAAAVSGLGVALLPVFMICDDLRAGRLAPALEDFEPESQGVHAVYPHNRHLSAKVRAFVDFLVDSFGPTPPWDVS